MGVNGLFGPSSDMATVNATLAREHYLGPTRRGFAVATEWGPLVFASPSSRHVPHHWLELVRWCLVCREPNAGSRAWAVAVRSIRKSHPDTTTIVSYSDPSAGHDGSLYRATGWLWAPTWHRLRPPPSGNGQWTAGKSESVKDRWVFLLKPDSEREGRLCVRDASILRRMPWVECREPAWRRGKPVLVGQNANWRRWKAEAA